MTKFEEQCAALFRQLGDHKKMVLSTSLRDHVTSRMMSIIILNGVFYFQTDLRFRKYEQLKKNPQVSLCADNVQIEGTCAELGHPLSNTDFCGLYQAHFPASFARYTGLECERLFTVRPAYIQKWIYEDGEPFVEKLDFESRSYRKEPYIGE